MESKALYTAIAFLLVCLIALFLFWAHELSREPILYEDPVPILDVQDKQLLTNQAKEEARQTGNSWAYIDGEFHHFEGIPKQYYEEN